MNIEEKFNLEELLTLGSKKLEEVDKTTIFNEQINDTFSLGEEDKFGVKMEAGAGARINILNDESDDDNISIAKKLKYESQFGNHAILNYDLFGNINVDTTWENNFVELGLEARKNILLSYYKIHPKQNTVLESITNDLTDFKFIFDTDHWTNLDENDALAYSMNGSLSFHSNVSISDSITAGLSGISKLFKLSEKLSLKIKSGIDAGFSAKIKDEFELIVQKRSGKLEVSINKSSRRELEGKLAVGIKVELDKPEILEEAVADVFDSIEEGLTEKIEKIAENISEQLESDQLEDIKRIAELLDIELPDDEFIEGKKEDIIAEITGMRKEIEEGIKNVINEKIKFSLGYTYSRIKQVSTIFKANFTPQAVATHKKSILKLQVDEILNGSQTGISDLEFSRLTKIDVKKSTKIGISIGNFSIGQEVIKDYGSDVHEIMKNGQRLYKLEDYEIGKVTKVSFGRGVETNSFEFGAKSKKFLPENQTTLADLDYEFAVNWHWEQGNKTKPEELLEVLDLALCWGIVKPNQFESTYKMLEGDVIKSKIKKTGFELHIKAPTEVFDILIDDIAGLSNNQLAYILAYATPYAEVNGRRTLNERINAYTGFWKIYLDSDTSLISSKTYDKKLSELFNSSGRHDLADYEEDIDGYSDFDKYRISRMLKASPIDVNIERFQSTFKIIDSNMASRYESILDTKKFKRKYWNYRPQSPLNIRFLGCVIHILAERNGVSEELERGLEIKLGSKLSNGKDLILIEG